MVSQGRRQFEGRPEEDSGANHFSSSSADVDTDQSVFDDARENKINADKPFTHEDIDSWEHDNPCTNRHKTHPSKANGTGQGKNILEIENTNSGRDYTSTSSESCKNNDELSHPSVSDDLSKLMNSDQGLDNAIIIGMDEAAGLSSFELPKDRDFQDANHAQLDGEAAPNPDNSKHHEGSGSSGGTSLAEGRNMADPSISVACMANAVHGDACEDIYGASPGSSQGDSQESACSSLPVSSASIVYAGVQPEKSVAVTNSLQGSSKTQHLTLNSESQLLLSGVQTIPEQLPLILTEGDAEDPEPLAVITGADHLQAVSTQAVLGNNQRPGTSGLMVFSSADVSQSGQIIPIGGTSLLVLHSLDGQEQLVQQNSVMVAEHPQTLSKSAEQVTPGRPTGKQYRCPVSGCAKIAPTSSKLKLHMLSHTGERPHKCPLEGCEWAFTTAYKLKRHIRGHTKERPFICEINGCGKRFTTTYNLKTHQQAHIREQTNVCSFENCGQSFSTLHKLRVHEKKHQLENELHTCQEPGCGKQFKTLSNYNAHVKTHNGERPHACTFEGCGKRFTKASKLKLHVRTHTGERPFVCDAEGCGWSFTSAYKLKRHMRKHTGERPFTCQFAGCGKSFTRASHMRTHALLHTGQKPFICPVADCLKGFTAASTLNIHMRKHSGDKPFKCGVEGCDKAYTTGANLRLHQKRHEEKNEDEAIEKEDHGGSDHPRPVRYVEIGGVNSVVETSPTSVPATPYAVMHTFSGEDFASEVPSLTVVQFSSEETFPSQAPVSTIDSSSGICFQFSTSDSYGHPPHNSTSSSISGLSFTAGTPLPSPGAHFTQTNMGEVDVEAAEELGTNGNERPFRDSPHDDRQQVCAGEFIVREHIVREHIVQEQSVDGEQAKGEEELGLPTMVVFTSSGVQPSEHSPSNPSGTDRDSREAVETQDPESNVSHLTLQRPGESSSIGQFAPPAIIFQGEEVKTQDGDVRIAYGAGEVPNKEPARPAFSVTTHGKSRGHNLPGGLPVSNLSLNLSSLSDDIDKSPVSPFMADVEHPLDQESTINLQDLR